MDTLTPAERSQRMSLIRSKNTKPEMLVRRLVYGLGYRYRLHVRDLPGTPDIVVRKMAKIILVHGCFWHRHGTCKNTRWPKSKLNFWKPKLEQNRRRDEMNTKRLHKLGWKVLVVWEFQTSKLPALSARLRAFLEKA